MTEPVHRFELTSLEHRVELFEKRVKAIEEARLQDSKDRLARSTRNGWILTGAIWFVAYSTLLVTIVIGIIEKN